MTEIFKDIEGYESYYQVSNLGRVKSTPHDGKKERFLKFDNSSSGSVVYSRVTLSKNGKTKRFQVHRLVAEAFLPNIENKPFINHIDNDGTNNAVTNLEWCTQSENMEHSANQGRQDIVRAKAVEAMRTATIGKAIAKYDSLIGTRVGTLLLESYTIDTSLKRRTPKFTCKCDCGNYTVKNIDQLRYRFSTCNECSRKLAVEKRQGKDIVSAAQKCVDADNAAGKD